MNSDPITQAKILVERLERLSADSLWAHRASGLRAALDKEMEKVTTGEESVSGKLQFLIRSGFEILEKAAGEIPES